MSARPFQVGDRVRIVGWDTYGPHEGTITEILPARMRTDGFLAGVPRSALIVTDCEYTLDSGTPALACAALNEDLTGAGWYGGQIELIEPVPALPQRVRGATLTPSYIDASPAPVSVVEYSCPVAGCDYMVGAAGPIDPDEPDYHAEDVQAHRASHLDDGRVHDVAEAERLAYDAEAEWAPVAPDPHAVEYARALVGEPADIGEDDGVSRSRFAPPADVEPYDGGRIPDTIGGAS